MSELSIKAFGIQVEESSVRGELERRIVSHLEEHSWGVVIIEYFEVC